MITTASAMQRALDHHRAGRLAEAAEIYREILRDDPADADALNLLGVVFHASGNFDMAITLTREATRVQPEFFAPYVNLGNALQSAGQVEDAVAAFERALRLSPDNPEAANNLSSALNALGRHGEAEETAAALARRLPDFAAVHNNLGIALAGQDRHAEAEASYRRAMDLAPGDADAHYNLARTLIKTGGLEEALIHGRRAVELNPGTAARHCNLGNVLQALARMEDAARSFEQALRLDPDYADAHTNLGAALHFLGRPADAIPCFRRALEIEPESPDLHWNLSLALLKNADYEEGWREYEWRWKTPTFVAFRRDFAGPEWAGEALGGRRILIHVEQGFGDIIQFARYAALVAARGGEVVLECRPGLERLFETLDGVAEVVTLGAPLPPYDTHIALMSLPRVMGTTVDTIPAAIPYLRVPAGAAADPVIGRATGMKVGIVWAGSPTRADNDKRSCGVERFDALFDLPGITFFALQVGDGRVALEPYLDRENIFDLAGGLGDFADTAAALAALDLVLSVDTSVLHLAGALGRPAWGLMSFPTGFLWMEERGDSPWYPTVRLFRQRAPGDWESVFAPLRRELAALAAGS